MPPPIKALNTFFVPQEDRHTIPRCPLCHYYHVGSCGLSAAGTSSLVPLSPLGPSRTAPRIPQADERTEPPQSLGVPEADAGARCPICGYAAHPGSCASPSPVASKNDLSDVPSDTVAGIPLQAQRRHLTVTAQDGSVVHTSLPSGSLAPQVPLSARLDIRKTDGGEGVSPSHAHHGCAVCRHPARAEIEAAMVAGALTGRQLEAQYALHPHVYSYHRMRCMHLAPMSKKESGRRALTFRQAAGPQCKACSHPDISTINAALRAGAISLVTLSGLYDLSDNLLGRHRMHCLGFPSKIKPRRKKHRVEVVAVAAPTMLPAGDFRAHVLVELAQVTEEMRQVDADCDALNVRRTRAAAKLRMLKGYLILADDGNPLP